MNGQKSQNTANDISSYLRMPPQDMEAEMSVLGSLMLDQGAIVQVIDILKAEDFYRENHRLIYGAMQDLFEQHAPIDLLSVASRLKEKKSLEKTGGNSYLTELVNNVPSSSNVQHYAEIVRKKRILRHLIEASNQINQLGYKEESDLDTILDEAEKTIFSIARLSFRQKFLKIKDALEEAWERIDRLHKSGNQPRGVPTGFADLDNYLSGLQKSDLVILAARPSFGKTALALDIARHVACEHKIPVGVFSLEMSSQQLVDRLLAAESQVDSWSIRTGKISTNEDFMRIRNGLERLASAPLFIEDSASLNIIQMRAMARRLQAELESESGHNLGLLVVDYIQLMTPRSTTDNPVQQMTEISRSLKSLAKELDVPILAISQLSRAVEQRNPPIPRLSDLRESGSIEQDADVVMFIHRQDKYRDMENAEQKNVLEAEIRIEKHRNGPTGKVILHFNPKLTTFTSIERGSFNVF